MIPNLYTVRRKYRNSNASSDMDFIPSGKGMELVGGDKNMNRTEVHINGENSAYIKYHDENQMWYTSGPDNWDSFQHVNVIGAPGEVIYDPSVQIMKTFYLGKADAGIEANYFQYHNQDGWTNLIQIPGPDLQPMRPAVLAWNGNDTRLDIFVVARANSHLLHASWGTDITNWTNYEDLHGCVTTPPVAVSRTPGVIDVFARGGDAGLWYLSYDDGNKSWTNWTRISGNTKIKGQPDAISVSSNRLDVFAWGEDGSMLHKSFDSTSKAWTPKDGFGVLVDGPLSGPPKAMSDAPGRIHTFAYNNLNELIWKTLDQSAQSGDTITLANVPMVR
ncbi:fucose-specific lectin [Annulohypoxylon bovei var. microspora]|nr:fucose-specific lectin [Annulohypoxylon bovei var. microspora]